MLYPKNTNGTTPEMGFCPIGKFVFSHEDALRHKGILENKLKDWRIPFAGLDDVIPDGVVRDTKHIGPVIDYFKKRNVQSIFMPHCNFGTEHAVGLIAREVGVPVLIWGPRDEAPSSDGTRLRDSLCGLFASTKVLHKMRIPYSYIENCWIDDEALEKGVKRFYKAANVSDGLRNGLRIGQIGERIDFFWTTIINESELLDKFKIEVLPLDMVELLSEVRRRAEKDKNTLKDELEEFKKQCVFEDFPSDDPLIKLLAMRDAVWEIAEKNELDAVSIKSFMSLIDECGAYTMFADGLIGEKLSVGFENDIHGAISCALLRRADFERQPTFLTEFTVRHPQDDNAVLLWHAGAPLELAAPDTKIRYGKHWILPSDLSGMSHFKQKDGPITVARFDGDHGEYKLAFGEGETTDGPDTLNNYCWLKVDDWPRWERTLTHGPFIHHTAMIYGHYADVLEEACLFTNALAPVKL